MRVSARADYALRAAIELAAASGSHLSAEQLTHAQNIPGRFAETILTQLRRTGLVRSQRGPDGGFRLARPASEISLADIIRAIDGQPPGAYGEPPGDAIYPGPAEPLRRAWIAQLAFGPAVLEALTLADIVSGELWLCRRCETFTRRRPSSGRPPAGPPVGRGWTRRPRSRPTAQRSPPWAAAVRRPGR
jgi:Rrf2 family protein